MSPQKYMDCFLLEEPSDINLDEPSTTLTRIFAACMYVYTYIVQNAISQQYNDVMSVELYSHQYTEWVCLFWQAHCVVRCKKHNKDSHSL